MTFQESDYPSLEKDLMNLIQRYKNPSLAIEILKEVWEIHKKIPIYPGIISTCLKNMIKPKRIRDLKTGEKVVIKTTDCELLGTIESKGRNRIVLKDLQVLKKTRRREIRNKEIKEILGLESDILKKTWPTLVPEDADDRRSKRKHG